MSLIFTVGKEFLPAHFSALTNSVGVNMQFPGSSTTTSSSFADTATGSSVSFTKVDGASRIRVDFHATCYVTAFSGVVEFAVRINGTDYAVVKMNVQTTSVHKQLSGVAVISSIGAGTYTVQGRWRRVSGSGTVTVDANDWLSFAVAEIQE